MAKIVVVVAVAMTISCGACSSSGSQGDDADDAGSDGATDWDGESPLFPRCIGEWPEAPAFSFKPSIEGAELDILWTKTFETDHPPYGMALAGERVAFTAGRSIYVLDLAGNLVAKTPTAELDLIYSGPSADAEGNFYFSGVRAYSVSNDGQARWSHPYGENLSNRFESTWARRFVISPDGVAYTASTDGYLYAFDTEDGNLLWTKEVGLFAGAPVAVGPGVGDTLFVSDFYQSYLYDKDSGDVWGRVPTMDGKKLKPENPSYGGQVTLAKREDHPEEYQGSCYFLDECGNMQWRLESERDWHAIVYLPDDSVIVSERDVSARDTPVYGNIFSPSGEHLLGPIAGSPPALLGADGVGYYVSCDEDESILTARDTQLELLGELSLGGPCWDVPTILSDAGVLYLTRYDYIEATMDLVAVQTSSPGLADTSWPAIRHDNRQSNWLAPLEPVQ